jgi:xanthine/uracil permease
MSTKCASRFTLVPAAAIMLILAFIPAATGFIGSMPSVVIGAVLAYVMTSQVAAGLIVAFRDVEGEGFQFENGLVIGLSILLGTIVAFLPAQEINTLPPFLRPILGNGFVAGVVSALILEHIVVGRGTGNAGRS